MTLGDDRPAPRRPPGDAGGSGPGGGGPEPGDAGAARVAGAVAVTLAALLPLAIGCGGEETGGGDRFSIGGRGLDAAVDSVRSARDRPKPRGGMGRGGNGGQRRDLPAGVAAALDSGNAAYRAGNYRAALEQFEAITDRHPDVEAGWFGVYMTQRALGDRSAADSAMRRAGMGGSRAARMHGTSGDSGGSPHNFTPDTAGSPDADGI